MNRLFDVLPNEMKSMTQFTFRPYIARHECKISHCADKNVKEIIIYTHTCRTSLPSFAVSLSIKYNRRRQAE